jgi:hypothetical protein
MIVEDTEIETPPTTPIATKKKANTKSSNGNIFAPKPLKIVKPKQIADIPVRIIQQAPPPLSKTEEHEFSSIFQEVKSVILDVIALPAKTKRNVMKEHLQQSPFIDTYINRQILRNNAKFLNDHIRFSIVWLSSFIKTQNTIESSNP